MKEFLKIFHLFLAWRILLFLVAFVALFLIPEFGARFPYYRELQATGLPSWIWGFGNFDGVYYLRIAQNGYSDNYTQAFFPLYPLLIKYLSFGNFYLLTGFLISNILFLAALYVLYKLFRLDFDKKTSINSLLLLLIFPTSFYFGAIYSESLFLLLTVICLYLTRTKKFFYAGLFAAAASATKIFGIMLFIVILLEMLLLVKKNELKVVSLEFIKALLGVIIAPIGLVYYMFYLALNFNSPFFFLSSQPAFGAERSSQPFILLPQVLFRYIKILTSVQIISFQYLNALLELLFTVMVLVLLVIFIKKMRLSYFIFTLGCFLIPTLTGTLSSMPRYILTSFLLMPIIALKFEKKLIWIFLIFGFLSIVLVTLFSRGYWVA